MALYDDFDLDITTGLKQNDEARRGTEQCNTVLPCRTDFDTCEMACSVTCTGVRTRPCDR